MKFRRFLPLLLSASLFLGGSVEAVKYSPPTLTAEFEQMAFMQLYPTFSWEPLPKTEFYQVRVVNAATNKVVRELLNVEALNRVTDWEPFTAAGEYYWQVRVVDKKHNPLSDWSEKKFFKVEMPVEFAAFGDSITHGGAAYIPAGQLSCQWETYCDVPIKNLARSGDTTEMMLERFDRDVLPFAPRVMVIMAGVNDYRANILGAESVDNLILIRDKCERNGIKPVFLTPTPLNPAQIQKLGFIDLPPEDWQEHQRFICEWIRDQENFIDVNEKLTDAEGNLLEFLSVDGLHPDAEGKKIIGEAVAAWLDKYLNLK